jgi:hypothetical protein
MPLKNAILAHRKQIKLNVTFQGGSKKVHQKFSNLSLDVQFFLLYNLSN